MATLARMAVEQTLAETLSCRRVLLVEDDRALNELLTEFLELQGLEVTAVESGDDALRELEGDAPPDIVLLDLRVPGISGGEVLRRMGKSP